MKAAFVLILALILAISVVPGGLALASTPTPAPYPTVTAQPSCGTAFSPCGALPFQLIQFPTLDLASPTLITVSGFVPLPSATPGTVTLTPSATPTRIATLDTGGVSTLTTGINGISATLFAQTTQTVNLDNTPSGASDMGAQLGNHAGTFFAAAKALELTNLNQAGGIVSYLFLVLGFILMVQILTLVIPIFLRIVNLILEVITALKPF